MALCGVPATARLSCIYSVCHIGIECHGGRPIVYHDAVLTLVGMIAAPVPVERLTIAVAL